MFEPLKLGNRVEMVFKSRSGDDDTVEYASQILDFTDEGIMCAMPIYEGHIVPLEKGKRFEGYFYSDNKIYRAMCSVVSRGKEEKLHVAEIKLDSALVRIQRREYYRLSCIMPASLRTVTDLKEGLDEIQDLILNEDNYKCTIVDISGGGIRVFSKRQLEKNEMVYVKFTLNFNSGDKEADVLAKVVDSQKNSKDETMFDSRLQFINISEADREEIVKYVFEQQRNMLKKELGYNG